MRRFNVNRLSSVDKIRFINEWFSINPLSNELKEIKDSFDKKFSGMKKKKVKNFWRKAKDNTDNFHELKTTEDKIYGMNRLKYYGWEDKIINEEGKIALSPPDENSSLSSLFLDRTQMFFRWGAMSKFFDDKLIHNSDVIYILDSILSEYAKIHPFLPMYFFHCFYSHLEDLDENQKIDITNIWEKYKKNVPMDKYNEWMKGHFQCNELWETHLKERQILNANKHDNLKDRVAIADHNMICDSEYIKVYRGFVVHSDDVVRDRDNISKQLSGRGLSYTLSKPIAIDFAFKENRIETSGESIKDLIIKTKKDVEQDSSVKINPAYEKFLNDSKYLEKFGRSTVATYLVKTSDILTYDNQRCEREIVVNPSNAKLLNYEFLSDSKFNITDKRYSENMTNNNNQFEILNEKYGRNVSWIETSLLKNFGKDLNGFNTLSPHMIEWAKNNLNLQTT